MKYLKYSIVPVYIYMYIYKMIQKPGKTLKINNLETNEEKNHSIHEEYRISYNNTKPKQNKSLVVCM